MNLNNFQFLGTIDYIKSNKNLINFAAYQTFNSKKKQLKYFCNSVFHNYSSVEFYKQRFQVVICHLVSILKLDGARPYHIGDDRKLGICGNLGIPWVVAGRWRTERDSTAAVGLLNHIVDCIGVGIGETAGRGDVTHLLGVAVFHTGIISGCVNCE